MNLLCKFRLVGCIGFKCHFNSEGHIMAVSDAYVFPGFSHTSTNTTFLSKATNYLLYSHASAEVRGWLIDWMVFYAAFNSISVISRRQFTLFMLSWVSPVLGWLWSVLPKDTPTKKPRGSSEVRTQDPWITSQTLYHWATWDQQRWEACKFRESYFLKNALGLLIDCMVFNAVSTVFQSYHSGQWTYPCSPRVLFTSTPHNILFLNHWLLSNNHCRNNEQQWVTNESCFEWRNCSSSGVSSCVFEVNKTPRIKICLILTLSQTNPGFHVSAVQGFWKHYVKKEKLLVVRNFSFSHCVFNLLRELSAISIKFEIVICKLFQFGRV